MKCNFCSGIIALVCIALPTVIRGQSDALTKKDSLLSFVSISHGADKIEALHKLALECFPSEFPVDTALKYLQMEFDEAVSQNEYAKAGKAILNRHVLFYRRNMPTQSLEWMDRDMKFCADHELWSNYYDLRSTISDNYLKLGESEKAIDAAMQTYEYAKQHGNELGIQRALYVLGHLYIATGRFKEAEMYLRQSLEASRRLNQLDIQRFYIYFYLINSLTQDTISGKQAPEILRQWETDLITFEKGKERNPAQWLNLYSQCLLYENCKRTDLDKMEYYCDLMDELAAKDNLHARSTIISNRMMVARERYQWDKMLDYVEQGYEISKQMGEYLLMTSAMKFKVEALIRLNRQQEAVETFFHYIEHDDSLKNLKFAAQIDQLRTEYEVDKHIAEKEEFRNYMFFAIGGCLLLAIALGIWVYYSYLVTQKNRSLYRQIQELSRVEKAAEQILIDTPEEVLSREMQLFRRLSELMQNEKLFTDPQLNRKSLADRLNTNEVYLAEAIRKGADAIFSAYISDLRLQYALELLGRHPETTLDAIAEDSGHGSYSPFFRAFTKKYGISPSEYRKLSASKEKFDAKGKES